MVEHDKQKTRVKKAKYSESPVYKVTDVARVVDHSAWGKHT